MKSCPTCRRTFEDTLTYCLVDGSILSPPFDPQATLLIPQQDPTMPMTSPATHGPAKSNKLLWVIIASVALGVAAIVLVIALVNRQGRSSETTANVAQQNGSQTGEASTNNRNSRNDNFPSISKIPTENKNAANANAQPDDETPAEDLRSLEKYAGQYAPDMFEKEAGLKERLRNLLGANYQLFMERWDVTAPIEEQGAILFAEGCMAHACGSEESLLAIDTSKGVISCAILSDSSLGGQFKTYSEGGGSPPSVMQSRMREIMSTK